MTEFFEVLDTDGAARAAELRIDPPVRTPARVDERTVDAGSLWVDERAEPPLDPTALTILPHRGFPAGTDERVVDAFPAVEADGTGATAAVVTAASAAGVEADVYILSDAPGMMGHAAAVVEAIIGVRERTPADTGLYLAGCADAMNVGMLVYAGVDLVDATAAAAAGYAGRYQTAMGAMTAAELTERPCMCPVCTQGEGALTDPAAVAAHNVHALDIELRRIRSAIDAGTLRDHVEMQSRVDQWLTGMLRRIDQQYGYLARRSAVNGRATIRATTDDTLRRVAIQRYAQRVTERYQNRFDNPLVLVPCSARKPYSTSQSHRQFYDAIDYRAHVVSMTSPIGVVPMELELTYPAQHYDTVVTGRWSPTEIEFVASVLRRYLTENRYPRVIAHVPEEGYRTICEQVAPTVDVPFTYTVSDHPTTQSSLEALAAELTGELRYTKRERETKTVQAIADYQFGQGLGEALFPRSEIELNGRYPKLQVCDPDGQQLAVMVPQYGLLALSLAGAKRWQQVAPDAATVQIDGFVPHGDVLAPGVTDADAAIRPGEEVLIDGPAAFGVGRAVMDGPAMVEARRGVAVDVRHIEAR
jgi:archaeosine synthase